MDRGWKPCIPDRRTPVRHQQMSTRATTARTRLQPDYVADLQSGATKYRDGQTSATVYPRGPPRRERSLPRAQTHAGRATRANPVHDPNRRISARAATTLGAARFGRNDINHFQGRSHGSLDRKAQRLGRRSGKIPAPGRALNPAATYGAVRFQTKSLRHVGEGAKFVLVTGEVAVPIEELKDFLSIPDHTLVFHKAPALKVLSQADAATTIQRRARGFLARAMGRRQQAAAITLQRHARGIAIRAKAGHHARCAGHPQVQGSEPWRASDAGGGHRAVFLDSKIVGSTPNDSPKVVRSVGSVGSEPTRGSEGEGGDDTFLHDGDWVHVVPEDIPPIPTTPQGRVIFTRLTLDQVDLVPDGNLKGIMHSSTYDNTTVAKAEDEARRSLIVRYFERQLKADRILTLYDSYNHNLLILRSEALMDCAQFTLSSDEKDMARARGFTRLWDWDYDEDADKQHYRRYFVRDKFSWE